MKQKKFLSLLFLLIIFMNINLIAQPLAFGKEKFLGNVFGFSGVPLKFDDYWNQITPENSTKWGSVESARDYYNWGRVDEIYNYAKQRGYPFKFHTLVWGQQYPNWITSLSLEEQREEVEEWIRLVGERYPDMDMVDVVNEPLPNHAPAPYRDALGGAGKTGWDWVIQAFEWARKYIPKAKLILNDYNIINDSYNTNQLLNIVYLLKQRNLIDGIGIQGHRFELENASINTLKSNLDKLAATGLPIYISEFDLGNLGDSGNPDDAKQLELYQKIFPLLWEHPGIKGITFWGYIEGQIWQKTCFLIKSDGTERPAMKWLRQYLTSKNSFRSVNNGNWEDLNTWEEYDGTTWIKPATKSPDASGDLIIIRNGHTVTLNSKDTVDQMSIAQGGKLIIAKGAELKIKDGSGVDLSVGGIIENYGTIKQDSTATISFQDGSKYYHKQDGGEIPISLWASGSTIEFDSIKTISPKNANQNFYHFVWNCPDQSLPIFLKWDGNTIGGNVNILNTGTSKLLLCDPLFYSKIKVTIMGDINLSGGELAAQIPIMNTSNVTIELNGNLNITGGKFFINSDVIEVIVTNSFDNQGMPVQATDYFGTIWKINQGNVSIKNAIVGNYYRGKIEFVRQNGIQSLTLENVQFDKGGLPVEVDSSVTLNIGTSELKGEGSFILNKGAVLQTAHSSGLDGSINISGEKILSSEAGYVFNGTNAQVTGTSIPDSVSSLIIDNNLGLTLSKTIKVNNLLEIKKGQLLLGGNKLIYGKEATLKYSGSVAQITRDEEFPEVNGPKNILITNLNAGVTLHASRKIEGRLEMQGKLKLGDNNLEVAEATSGGTSRYVITDGSGELRISVGNSEVLFPVGTPTSYAPVWIENKGTKDLIGVNVKDDKIPAAAGGRVLAKWFINEAVPGGGNYALKFGWLITLEDSQFRQDRNANAYIFNLQDTTEAGSGFYERELSRQPYAIKRGGIDKLGIFAVGKFKTITDISKDDIVQNNFYLSQNYPNPFNPVTTIKFTIPNSSNNHKTTLKIFDILGNEIETLIDEVKSSGTYEVKFDASKYSSGVYFYKLQCGNFMQVRKMTLIK
ncbi:MAG: endo-1,4-beta-xylanase [Melioribacteraceae bacterium]